jgi:glycine C-acetyltransferase
MSTTNLYSGGENFDLRQVLLQGRALPLQEKLKYFDSFLEELRERRQMLCMREIISTADREISLVDPFSGAPVRMLMFGSNNYLGLANHRVVKERAHMALDKYGAGIGGPPLLNGYTRLHRELEERLAALKHTEDAMVFSSGYGANVGLVSGLLNPRDSVFYDGYSHASFCDGIKLANAQSYRFPHNDCDRLESMLSMRRSDSSADRFVGVEGVYSMDGDLAPLDRMLPICKSNGAILMLDDAHGTGVMGPTGAGTPEHFGLEGAIDIVMGTFSKTFTVTGGFVAASKSIVNYLRFFARSYMFSASLPPAAIATVIAGLDVIEQEPELLARLRENVRMASAGLNELGFDCSPQAAIIPLRVPAGMNIRQAGYEFHKRGIFINSVEYPAVPVSQQRFRISLMATHTRADIDRLLTAVEEIWNCCGCRAEADYAPLNDCTKEQ